MAVSRLGGDNMAIIRRNPLLDDNSLVQPGMSGGSGLLGGGDPGGTSQPTSPQTAAPTNSGMRFTNIQRYLDRNPVMPIDQGIKQYADNVVGSTKNNFDKQYGDYMGQLGRAQQASMPLSKEQIYEKLGLQTRPGGGDFLKPYFDPSAPIDLPAFGYKNTGEGMPDGSYNLAKAKDIVSNPYELRGPTRTSSLMSELATNKPSYTPGMEAMDAALMQATGQGAQSSKDAAKRITDLGSDITSRTGAAQQAYLDAQNTIKSNREKTKAAAQELFDQNAGTVDTLEQEQKYQRLASLLGLDPSRVKRRQVFAGDTKNVPSDTLGTNILI